MADNVTFQTTPATAPSSTVVATDKIDGERVRFVLRSRVDDNEIVEILTMIINSGVLDQ